MVNRHRGEVGAVLNGTPFTLCLTLGALAELEDAYGGEDLVAIAERFEKGRIGARDVIRVLAAGLRGGGHAVTDEEVAAMSMAGGAPALLALMVELLKATFAPEASS